jgi:hypothetical protein
LVVDEVPFAFFWLSLIVVSGFIASGFAVVGDVGSVGLPAVGVVGGIFVSPALGDVEAGGVSIGGVGEVDGEVALPVVGGWPDDAGAVCCAIIALANIAEQTSDARRADFREKHFMRCLALGKISRSLRWRSPGLGVSRKMCVVAMQSNPDRML